MKLNEKHGLQAGLKQGTACRTTPHGCNVIVQCVEHNFREHGEFTPVLTSMLTSYTSVLNIYNKVYSPFPAILLQRKYVILAFLCNKNANYNRKMKGT